MTTVRPTAVERAHAQHSPHRPQAVLTVTAIVTAIALMDYTAPALTLHGMTADFHTPASEQAWLLNGTSLGLAALLLVAGSLADDYGRRRAFLTGTIAMSVATGLGTLASSTLTFTLARVALGAACALIISSSLGLIAHAYPAGHGRVRAMGVWGAAVSGGTAIGPLVAGGLAEVNWRLGYAAFAVAALLAAAVATRVLGESKSSRGGRPDLPGAAALGAAMSTLLTALTLGRDGWLRLPVALLLVATVLLATVFVAIERHSAAPMIDLSLLRRPPFLASMTGALFTGLSVIALFSYLPALLQQTIGISAIGAAWLVCLWSGVAFLVALQARRLTNHFSARHQLALGFLLTAVGALTMLGAVPAGSWPRLLPGVVVSGLGTGLLNAALPRLAVDSVPPERASMGSGANNTARYIGSAAGVALTIAVATSSPGHQVQGADKVLAVTAVLALLGAVTTLALRERSL
ncbi:MFS transporter [Streptomyces sp. 5-10]|uniref:MFS transporter n=1 Tax=Streptomyces sp. 5-10 TaxID=878925 RepID=UPI00168AC13C|nr:MFS transporter [Streptomyces sp. 5-10]MBD3004230.1 MFS transporter [Streptomyces sp. 5-10]